MARGRTFAEKVLSEHAGTEATAGDIVVCEPDLVLGTDGSVPMAIDYFEAMEGARVAEPGRVLFARDHYAPPTSKSTRGFHDAMVAFAAKYGVEILDVGDGVGFLVALERGRVGAGDLVVGGDSHTVTCGVRGAFAAGIGSSDLAGAFLTGRVWLRVPETVSVRVDGEVPSGVGAKDVALELVRRVRGRLGPFTSLEFGGSAIEAMPAEERIVLANMSAEMGAMAGVFPSPGADDVLTTDADAAIAAVFTLDVSGLEPRVALPHDPANTVPVTDVVDAPIDWVFLGTCTGGRVHDFHEALALLDAAGGIAAGVTVAVVPPTATIRAALQADGTLAGLEAHGAIVGTTGCGPCCGTSDPLPPAGAHVISTANRNFRARMGDPSVTIMLASPATCAAAAAAGRVVDPRGIA